MKSLSLDSELDRLAELSSTLRGWISAPDAQEVARVSWSLPGNPTIVEIGVFMGRGTALLAGARQLRGAGRVHCVDPFDCSGDAFSVPVYLQELSAHALKSLEDVFRENMRNIGLSDWIEIHRGQAKDVAATWTKPVDLLVLDGDQSPEGANEAFQAWLPFLKGGGAIVLRNTKDRIYAEGHDGHRKLAIEKLISPDFENVRQIGATTFATRTTTQNL